MTHCPSYTIAHCDSNHNVHYNCYYQSSTQTYEYPSRYNRPSTSPNLKDAAAKTNTSTSLSWPTARSFAQLHSMGARRWCMPARPDTLRRRRRFARLPCVCLILSMRSLVPFALCRPAALAVRRLTGAGGLRTDASLGRRVLSLALRMGTA